MGKIPKIIIPESKIKKDLGDKDPCGKSQSLATAGLFAITGKDGGKVEDIIIAISVPIIILFICFLLHYHREKIIPQSFFINSSSLK